MTTDAEYLLSLANEIPETSSLGQLKAILSMDDLRGKPANPLTCTASYALAQAKRRLENSTALGKATVGLEDLIASASSFKDDDIFECYIFENSTHIGTCYVFDGGLLGCEFVLRTGTQTLPGLWIDGKRVG
ncbi:hypothetical protein [Caldimonas brevitalea]|uniref:hypothetical protein n=1 Tax=Caldimonas brevitalea TaxID=413882 RepID=UPI0012FC3367|nr:hypothetical protein [Caldimonas brevitalea]